jgi:hypothetical protein
VKTIKAVAITAAAFGAVVASGSAATAQTETTSPSPLRVVDVTSDHVDLAWSSVPGATRYLVDGPPCSPVDAGNGTAARINSISIDPNCGMFAGETYTISVHAQFSDGAFSPFSNTVSVTLP